MSRAAKKPSTRPTGKSRCALYKQFERAHTPNPRFAVALDECAALVSLRADLRRPDEPAKLIALANVLARVSDKRSSRRRRQG